MHANEGFALEDGLVLDLRDKDNYALTAWRVLNQHFKDILKQLDKEEGGEEALYLRSKLQLLGPQIKLCESLSKLLEPVKSLLTDILVIQCLHFAGPCVGNVNAVIPHVSNTYYLEGSSRYCVVRNLKVCYDGPNAFGTMTNRHRCTVSAALRARTDGFGFEITWRTEGVPNGKCFCPTCQQFGEKRFSNSGRPLNPPSSSSPPSPGQASNVGSPSGQEVAVEKKQEVISLLSDDEEEAGKVCGEKQSSVEEEEKEEDERPLKCTKRAAARKPV